MTQTIQSSVQPKSDTQALRSGVLSLLKICGNAKASESILIIYDDVSADAAQAVVRIARDSGLMIQTSHVPIPRMHGEEPPDETLNLMKESSLILGMASKSMAHTRARIAACEIGARFLSLPEYSIELLQDRCLLTDYRGVSDRVRKTADLFTRGNLIHVTTSLGTNLEISISDRVGNYCPGFVEKAGDLGSPPDIEANVSPLEDGSNGILVVDGSIPYPGFGLLKSPVTLKIEDGLIVDISSDNLELVGRLETLFRMQDPKKTKILAELGIGFNDNAQLQGIMLTDEGAAGTAHCGFGSNSTVGGKNVVSFHLDFIFRAPTISVDGTKLLEQGRFVL